MLLLFCGGCSEVRDSHELLHSLLWMRTSAEYHVLSVMTYQRARDALDRALIDTRSTASIEQTGDFQHLPPAVILDLDETVLDNSPFEARLIAQRTTFNQPMWEQWVQEASAQAVPGVLEFIAEARKKGSPCSSSRTAGLTRNPQPGATSRNSAFTFRSIPMPCCSKVNLRSGGRRTNRAGGDTWPSGTGSCSSSGTIWEILSTGHGTSRRIESHWPDNTTIGGEGRGFSFPIRCTVPGKHRSLHRVSPTPIG
ncbi:MAG: hypothetical protein IPO99_19420 [Nitrospira sp.]|nr:hypothetical protein [Nitrospira sp.]